MGTTPTLIDIAGDDELKNCPSILESSQGAQLDVIANHGVPSFRKTALSKREMMEELSRQRFPWDD